MSAFSLSRPASIPPELIGLMNVGLGAQRSESGVLAPATMTGHVVHGPELKVPAGRYRASFFVRAAARWAARDTVVFMIEAVDGDTFFAQRAVRGREAENGVFDLFFDVAGAPPADALELRLWSYGKLELTISRVELRPA